MGILDTVKQMIGGIDISNVAFDNALIPHINAALLILYQIGITEEPVMISGSSDTWDAVTTDARLLSFVKNYVAIKTKVLFDPPSSSAMQAANDFLKELEYRMYIVKNPEGTF